MERPSQHTGAFVPGAPPAGTGQPIVGVPSPSSIPDDGLTVQLSAGDWTASLLLKKTRIICLVSPADLKHCHLKKQLFKREGKPLYDFI